MREIRTSGSEGGGAETNRFSLPLSAQARSLGLGPAVNRGLGRGTFTCRYAS
jgi:hypothetical protein